MNCDVVSHHLAMKAASKVAMFLPAPRHKMKAMRPPLQPKHFSSGEHAPPYNSHIKACSNTKQQTVIPPNITPPTKDFEFHVVKHDHVLQTPSASNSREEVEIQVWSNATHFFGQANDNAFLPLEVDINGLYILIIDTNEMGMLKFFVDDPNAWIHSPIVGGWDN